jgi:hypothetical protein
MSDKYIDERYFPPLLQAVLRCLITLGLRSPTGPAVTQDLLNMMRKNVRDGVDIGEHEYEIMVCDPLASLPADLARSLGKSSRHQPFFVIVEKGPGDIPEHPKGILKLLRDC